MKICRWFGSIFLSFVLLFGSVPAVSAADAADVQRIGRAADAAAAYLLNTVTAPQIGAVGGEWSVIGLARGNFNVPQSYWEQYYEAASCQISSLGGVLHSRKYTEYSRVILALTAIGADPRDVAGYHLLEPLGDYEKTVAQGVNGPIWALIALDSKAYEMPVNSNAKTQATRQLYLDRILSCQLADGGWSEWGGGSADADTTAMALQALAGYRSRSDIAAAANRALTCLSRMQDPQGNFGTLEGCAQVLIALCSFGIDVSDLRFIKSGNTVADALLRYQKTDGSFCHTIGESRGDLMSTEQGLCALAAEQRFLNGAAALYSMQDVQGGVLDYGKNDGLSGKHADVLKVPVMSAGVTFSDSLGHANQTAIEALAARGIINGRGSGLFVPSDSMTRAEFSTIVVRALGLKPKAVQAFDDVASNAWYAPYVGTAYTYGIVNGVGNHQFNPSGTITRQEAAVMAMRAAALCGLKSSMSPTDIRDALALYEDYRGISGWAQEAMAFCYQENLFNREDLRAEPLQPILRCEIAELLYRLLGRANLL